MSVFDRFLNSIKLNDDEDLDDEEYFDEEDPGSLKPKRCTVLVDRSYIIAAMGLLSQYYPDAALTILKEELVKDDGTK